MKQVITAFAALAAAAITSGCATTGTDGVVTIGPDQYMIGGLGGFTDWSGSAVKVRMFRDASKYCEERNLVMVPGESTGRDAGFARYASAEVQFRCLPK